MSDGGFDETGLSDMENPGVGMRLTRSSGATWSFRCRRFPMEAIVDLSGRGDDDHALDLAYDEIDSRLTSGAFAECESILDAVDPEALSSTVSVGFLAITKAADEHLSASRSRLRARVEAVLSTRMPADRLARVLAGL